MVTNSAGSPISGEHFESDLDSGDGGDDAYLAQLGYKSELNRVIGLFSSFAVQFSCLGVFSVTYVSLSIGLGYFGPASWWAWVIGGAMQVLFVGVAIGELVSAYPLAGGVYQINSRILRNAKHRFMRSKWLAWQSGWWVVVAHTVSVAAVTFLMVPYIVGWFGVEQLSTAAMTTWALALCALTTVINVAGVRIAALVNNIGVVAELAIGALAIVALLVAHHVTHGLSFLNTTGGVTEGRSPLTGFLFSLLLPLFVIQSFDSTGNAAEETVDAARKAPQGMLLANALSWLAGTVFIGLLYLAIPDLTAILASATPGHDILVHALGAAFTQLFEAIAILALVANMVAVQLTGARVTWSLARDGQLPAARALSLVSKNKVPVNATLVVFVATVVVIIICAQSASAFAILSGLTALSWAAAYGLAVGCGLYALVTKALPKRPFNVGRLSTPVYVIALAWSILGCAVLIWQNPAQVGGGMLGAIVVGTILYWLVPRRQREPDTAVAADTAGEAEAR